MALSFKALLTPSASDLHTQGSVVELAVINLGHKHSTVSDMLWLGWFRHKKHSARFKNTGNRVLGLKDKFLTYIQSTPQVVYVRYLTY